MLYAIVLGALKALWFQRIWFPIRIPDLMFMSLAFLVGVMVLLAARTTAQGAAVAQSSTKPNIVLIVADDLGYGDLGIYGATDALTPHIDSIGADGILFENFYVSPVCTPTRFSLLTGLHVNRAQDEELNQYILNQMHDLGIHQDKVTLAEAFKAEGYQTGIVGKWHLGHGEMPAYPPENSAPDSEFHPNYHGFDYFFGTLGGAIDYNTHRVWGGVQNWFENRNYIPGGEHGEYATHRFTDNAVNFIEQNAGSPFFLYVPYTAPHLGTMAGSTPLQRNQLPVGEEEDRIYLSRFDDVYPDDESFRKRFLAMIAVMDDGVGEILDTLSSQGLTDNTIVVFISDNGAQEQYGGSNAPFWGFKGSLYDGGIHVPALIKWPTHISAGQVSSQLVQVIDIFPTLLALSNQTVISYPVDGLDLSAHILGGDVIERDIRFANRIYGNVYRRGDWKYIRFRESDAVDQLYNLETDVGETQNVADQYPEILAELKTAHSVWEASLYGSVEIRNVVVGLPPEVSWRYSGSFDEFFLASNTDTTLQLPTGSHNISETTKIGYTTQAACSTGNVGSSSVVIDLLPGADVSCTFTNTAQPASLTIISTVGGQLPPDEWHFDGNVGSFTLPNTGGNQVFVLDAGSYAISETVKAGYTTQAGCSNGHVGSGSMEVDLLPGTEVTCTFTNTAQPATLTLTSTVIGQVPQDEWLFDGDVGSFIVPAAGGSQSFRLEAGSYDIRETLKDGYETEVACSNGIVGNSIVTLDVLPGDNISCTFTNTAQPATLTITSTVGGYVPTTEWHFHGDVGEFGLPNAGGSQSFRLEAGTYAVTEVKKTGYATQVGCSTGDVGNEHISVELGPGADVSCTFTNVAQPATLVISTIIEGQAPEDAWLFDGDVGSFTLPRVARRVYFPMIYR